MNKSIVTLEDNEISQINGGFSIVDFTKKKLFPLVAGMLFTSYFAKEIKYIYSLVSSHNFVDVATEATKLLCFGFLALVSMRVIYYP